MSQSRNFEDLECWRQAKDLAVLLYHVSMNGNLKNDLHMKEQLRKSAIFLASNIAGGRERRTPSERLSSLHLAKASAAELRTQLMISREVGYFSEGDFLDLEDKTIRISSIITSLIKSLEARL